MDTTIPPNKNSVDSSDTGAKNAPVLTVPKKEINKKAVFPGLKNLPLAIISETPNIPKKEEKQTVLPKETPTETADKTEIVQGKEFRVPKKPERANVDITKTAEGNILKKDSVDLSKKTLGWKTMTPTINIAEEDFLKNKNNVLPTKNKPEITHNVAGETHKEKVPKSSAEDVSALPTIRTYKKDVAGTIRGQKTTLVRMVLEEQKARAKRELDESPQSRKNVPLIIFSIIFFFLAVGIVYYSFFRPVPNNSDTVFASLNTVPLIGTEYTKEIDTTNQTTKALTDNIAKELGDTNLRLDTIEYIYFTEKYTTTTDKGTVESKKITEINKLFDDLLIPVPANILRSLKSDYLFGIHTYNGNQPFLVLKTDYYASAFSGMLDWEKTLLPDIFPLFGVVQTDDLKDRTWTDVVIKNQNLRELINFNNQIVLVYMFKDQNTLIISTNETTLFEVSRRLDLIQEKK